MLREHDFLVIAVQERELFIRAGNSQRQTGKTGPGTNIQNTLALEQGRSNQAVKKMCTDHLFAVANRCQVDFAIPALEFVKQCVELLCGSFGQVQLQLFKRRC